MDRDCLKVVFESLVEDMNSISPGLFLIEGPTIRKKKDVYNAIITFWIYSQDEKREKQKLMDLKYDINLKEMTDEDIFATIALSILEAREKIRQTLVQLMKDTGMMQALQEEFAIKNQREYIV